MHMTNIPSKLTIAVTHFYEENRFEYLKKVGQHWAEFGDQVEVTIVTDRHDAEAHNNIIDVLKPTGYTLDIVAPNYLGHGFLLPWVHIDVLRKKFHKDESISHFMYIENDLYITPSNIRYWMEGREILRESRLIPGFCRYECRKDSDVKYITDQCERLNLTNQPSLDIENTSWLNVYSPYQGCYLLDREQEQELLCSEGVHPDYGQWNIRERATQGLLFVNIPAGYWNRHLLRFDRTTLQINSDCLIHHTPNNYANDSHTPFGKIPVYDLLIRENEQH